MVATSPRPRRRRHGRESGFTLVEFMIAALITTVVLGGTVALAMQIQQGYATQLDEVAVEQEARFALDWIARDLRSAASDPYDTIPEEQEIWLDPNAGTDLRDSIRIQADVNPPDGVLDDEGESITIAISPVDDDSVNRVITRQDANAPDPAAVAMTDAIFTDLQFTYLNASRDETTNSALVAYIRVQVTARSRSIHPVTRQHTTSTLATDVRLRTR